MRVQRWSQQIRTRWQWTEFWIPFHFLSFSADYIPTLLSKNSLKQAFLLCWHSTHTKQEERCHVKVDRGWKSSSQSRATLADVMSLLTVSNFPEGNSHMHTHTITLLHLELFQSHSKTGGAASKSTTLARAWKSNSKLNSADFKVIIKLSQLLLHVQRHSEEDQLQCLGNSITLARVN